MPDSPDLFRYQFDTREPFRRSQTERGGLDYVDLDLRGPIRGRKVSITGMPAILNRIILYFASKKGDYLRTREGNEFAFIYNSPVNATTQFRVLSTATSIMRRRFPEVNVRDISVKPIIKRGDGGSESKGWDINMVIRHSSLEDDVSIDIPLGEETAMPSARDYIQV